MRKYIISRYITYTDGRSLLRAKLIPLPVDAKVRALPRLFTQVTHYSFLAYIPEGFEVGTIVRIPDSLIGVTNADYQVEIVALSEDEFIVQRKP